jgi:hypothetical protein
LASPPPDVEVFVGAVRRMLRFSRAPCVLRSQPHIELNLNFVFVLDAQFTGRLDPEVGLFHFGLACVVAILQQHLYGDRPCLAAQRQLPAQRPPPLTGRLRARGIELDLLIEIIRNLYLSPEL